MNWNLFLIAIRWQNVLIIWLMQVVVYFLYVLPYCDKTNYSFLSVLLFLGATGTILGGGNIFNDLQDIHTDALHPGKPKLVGEEIPIAQARNWYYILTGLAIFFLILGWWFFNWQILLVGVFIAGIGLLCLYSIYLKSTILIGNIVVALLCAAAVWMTTLLNPTCELSRLSNFDEKIPLVLYGYFANAFMITLHREIVKDKEDAIADKSAGILTIGSINESLFSMALNGFLVTTIVVNGIWFYFLHSVMDSQDWNLGLFMIFIPLILITLIFNLPHKPKIYSFLSKLIKVYILFAILLLILWQRS